MRTNCGGFESVLPRLNPLVKQDRILGGDSGSNKVQDVGPGGGGWWPSARQHPRRAASSKIRSPSRPSVVLPSPSSIRVGSLSPSDLSWSLPSLLRPAIPRATTRSSPRPYPLLLPLLCRGCPPCYLTSFPFPHKATSSNVFVESDRFSRPFGMLMLKKCVSGVVGSGITRDAGIQATFSGRLNDGILHRSHSSTKRFAVTLDCTLAPRLLSASPFIADTSGTTQNWTLPSVSPMLSKNSRHWVLIHSSVTSRIPMGILRDQIQHDGGCTQFP